MSSTATSLIPSSVSSTYNSAVQTTRSTTSSELSKATEYVIERSQELTSTYNSALRTTRTIAASTELSKATGYVSEKLQQLTPSKSAQPQPTQAPATPSPGTFRHPRTTEIIARQSAGTLTDKHIKSALTNAGVLVASYLLNGVFETSIVTVLKFAGLSDPSQISSTSLLVLRIVLIVNVLFLLRPALPYIGKKDDLTDIPLTPSQRSLLGLNPSAQSTPASVASGGSYITPPRYRRGSGSFSGSPNGPLSTDRRSISANYSASPLSTSRYTLGFSPAPSQLIQRVSGSQFSPSPSASPLFHKVINQSSQISDLDFNASTGQGLGRSQSVRERPRRESVEPASPSAITRGTPVVPGLNYKWLYDKGRKLPKSESYGF